MKINLIFPKAKTFSSYMKCIAFILVLGFGSVSAKEVVTQNEYVTLHLENKPLRDVFLEIESKNGYVFYYSSNTLKIDKKVSINVNKILINKVLDELLKNTDNIYQINGKQVFIKQRKKGNVVDQNKSKNRERTLVGRVVDASNDEPLIGVSIMIKGLSQGTVTNQDGQFSIQVNSKTELAFNYIGFKKQTLIVGDLGTVTIKMESSDEQLGEVVVVGAGVQKKVSVTGAITAVKGMELRAPSSSLTSNFAGKLAGVISMTKSGEPGSTSEFYIRGISTFGGRATPLILLDDVEISSGDLNNIPAESIESFSILKDASATAIYGARGANGVMLVTTKTGIENQKAQINVSAEASFARPQNQVSFTDGPRYMELYNEALLSRKPDATPKYTQEAIDNTRSGINPYVYPNVNWYNLLFKKNVYSQRGNLSVQGGGSKVTYYMGLQANHDSGMFQKIKRNLLDTNIDRWKYVFQGNISYKLTSTTNVSLRMNTQIGTFEGPNVSSSNLFDRLYDSTPVEFPAYYPAQEGDTHIRFGNAYRSGKDLYENPYAYLLNGYSKENTSTINTSLFIKQTLDFLTKGLNITTLINFKDYTQSSYTERYSPFFYQIKEGSWNAASPDKYELEPVGSTGTEFISQSGLGRYSDNTFYFDARLNYNRNFGFHTVSGMLMYMMREFKNDVLPRRNQGLSGRFTYDYQNKYLAEFNFGYNGTERLNKGERFEFFPAVSLGWVISNENFWKSINPMINFLKLRGSYGLVGSDETGENAGSPHFLYRNDVSLESSHWFITGENVSFMYRGPIVNTYPVQNAHWERVKKLNVGFDMNLFNQFNVVFDYFHDKRDRILLKRGAWPVMMGYMGASPWSNIGKVDNKGFEISVDWKNNIGKEFFYQLKANFTYNKNKYVFVDEPTYPYSWQTKTGKPLSYIVGYVADGLFKDKADIDMSPKQNLGSPIMPGDIKYRDINGDGQITAEDQIVISPYGATPRIQYGFGFNLNYKHIDFGVFFNGSAKRTIMIGDVRPFCAVPGYPGYHGDRNVLSFIADDHWSLENQNSNAEYPRLGVMNTQVDNNGEASTFWKRNGNFIRFKTLEIGYNFSFVRVYLSGDNLAVWSPFKHWDPELSWNSYPLSRTFNLGAQFKF